MADSASDEPRASALTPEPPPAAARVPAAPSASLLPPPPSSTDLEPVSTLRSVSPEPIPISARSRSLPPLPAIESVLDVAHDARERRDWDGALDAYRKALFILDPNDDLARASLYASVAEVKLAQGRAREAETNFEKALAANPAHVRSLDGLVALASEQGEWPRAIAFRNKRVDLREGLDERVKELVELSLVVEERLGDALEAAAVLERARRLAPDDVAVLDRLASLYERSRKWALALGVRDELYRIATSPAQRAECRLAQAELALGRLRDEPRAVAFLELALDELPTLDRALSTLTLLRTKREEWAELAAVYERQIDRLSGLGDASRVWEHCKKLAILRRDKLLDGPGAVVAFRGALELRPDDVESRAALAELYAAKGERTLAVRELERVTDDAPTRAQTYRRLYDFHARAGRTDRAWLSATCLEELSAADVVHQLVIEQYRPEGPIRPTTGVEAAWWDECLRAPGADPIACELVGVLSRAAIEARLQGLEASKTRLVLDPATKLDKASTASVVRTFVWASRVLGIAMPDLYLRDDLEEDMAVVAAPSKATALGRGVRSGRSVQELAFAAGRHLTYYRPEYYLLVFYPTFAELETLIMEALRIVIPQVSLPPRARDEHKSARSRGDLAERLTAAERDALASTVARLDARGGKLDLFAWIRHVELTAARAGLVLAGDLRVALRTVKAESSRSIGGLSVDEKRKDLLGFTASEAYGALRERMGVSILPASPPGAPPSPTSEFG